MEIKMNIQKTHFWILLIALVVIGAGIFVYAAGNTQGHPASQITDFNVKVEEYLGQHAVGGCQEAWTSDSSARISCANGWGEGSCVDTTCNCPSASKMPVFGAIKCWTATAYGWDSTCYLILCIK